MQALYQSDLQKKPVTDFIDLFLDEMAQHDETADWAKRLAISAYDFVDQSDDIINEYAENWDFSRLNPVDKAILRIAIYELNNGSLHKNVVLNEAIEIAKSFSTEESATFINGILGKYVSCLPES